MASALIPVADGFEEIEFVSIVDVLRRGGVEVVTASVGASTEIAGAHGVSVAQVILRWNLQRGVVVIPGSGNPAHILENTLLDDFELTDGEMDAIAALDRGEKHDWY